MPRGAAAGPACVLAACPDFVLLSSLATSTQATRTRTMCAAAYNVSLVLPASINNDVTSACLWDCNISALYMGPCSCPNDCSSLSGQGSCLIDELTGAGHCECVEPWGGPDCSIQPSCSAAGACSGAASSCTQDGVDGQARCQCTPGRTGSYCYAPLEALLPTPVYPPLYPTIAPYSPLEPYGDAHPVFNASLLARFDVSVAPDDLARLLIPTNINAGLEVLVNVTYDNGVSLRAVLVDVAMAIKGASSRAFLRKGFKFDFAASHSSQRLLNLAEVGLKSASDDPSMMRGALAMDMARALGMPFQRLGFAQLWINSVYYGPYLVLETYNDDWVQAHLPPADERALIRCGSRAWFNYAGPSRANYEARYDVKQGSKAKTYEAIINVAVRTNVSTSLEQLAALVDTDQLLRYLMLELTTLNLDGFTRFGNNYFATTILKAGPAPVPAPGVMQILPYDLEDSFGFDGATKLLDPLQPANWTLDNAVAYLQRLRPSLFFNCSDTSFLKSGKQPFACALSSNLYFALAETQFAEMYSLAVPALFGSVHARNAVSGYGAMLGPLLNTSLFYGLDFTLRETANQTNYNSVALGQIMTFLQARALTVVLGSRKRSTPPAGLIIASSVLGAGLVALALAGLAYFVLQRRRRRTAALPRSTLPMLEQAALLSH